MKNTLRVCTGMLTPLVLMTFMHDAMALGLGNVSVNSYLNQPLQARIALTSRADEDISTLTAGLASADDFALIGASLESIPVPLSFSVNQEAEGSYILVSSSLAVRDPVIRLIVEVNWAKGRMLREYTLFLDPPVFAAPAPSPVVSERPVETPTAQREPAAASPADIEPEVPGGPENQAEQTDGPAAAATAETPSPGENVTAAGGEGEYGPVQSGETLWRIASSWSQGTGLGMNAAMLAIQRNNPQAFINGNVNLLKQGAILRLPEFSEAAQISAEDARSEILQQSQTMSAPALQAEVPTAVETPLVDELSDESVTASETPPDGQKAQLELVPPAKATDTDSTYGVEESMNEAGASTSIDSMSEELARKEEELIAQQQENKYLQERVKEMEATLSSDQGGTVADQELAQIEKNLRDDRLAKEGFESPQAETPADEKPQTPAAVAAQEPKNENAQKQQSWFSGATAWLIGLLVLGAVAAGWVLSRRGREAAVVGAPDAGKDQTVKGVKHEAEKILKPLEPETRLEAVRKEPVLDAGEPADIPPRVLASRKQDEAEFLDEDSADPEVRLDLARAYIAMGDREAARVILAEVIEHGSEQQKAESQTMLATL